MCKLWLDLRMALYYTDVSVWYDKHKTKINMRKKDKKSLREKTLYDWASAEYYVEDLAPFLLYCQDYFLSPSDMITRDEFEKLKAGFEY